MVWQDSVLCLGVVAFTAAAALMLADPRTHVNRWVSWATAGVLAAFGAVYWSLGLWWSAAAEVAQVACWIGIAVRRGAVDPRSLVPRHLDAAVSERDKL